MSKYQKLLAMPFAPTKDQEKKFKDFKQAIFTMVSCMCDNTDYVRLTMGDGMVKISHYSDHCALSLSNLQMQSGAKDDIDWYATDGELDKVLRLLNSGTSKVESMRIR